MGRWLVAVLLCSLASAGQKLSIPEDTRLKLDAYVAIAAASSDEDWTKEKAECIARAKELTRGVSYLVSVVSSDTTEAKVRLRLADVLVTGLRDGTFSESEAFQPLEAVVRNRAELDDFRFQLMGIVATLDKAMVVPLVRSIVLDPAETPTFRASLIEGLPAPVRNALADSLKSLLANTKNKIELRWRCALELSGRNLLKTVAVAKDAMSPGDALNFLVEAFGFLPPEAEGRREFAESIAALAEPDEAKTLFQDGTVKPDLRIALGNVILRAKPDILGPMLVDVLKSKGENVNVRAYAAEVLAQKEPQRAGQDLANILKDPKEEKRIRWLAADTIGNLRLADAIPSLIEALADDDFSISERSAKALRSFGQDQLRTPLLEALLKPTRSRSRVTLAAAIGDAGLTDGIPLLVLLLEAGSEEAKAAALRALAQLNDKRGVPFVERFEPGTSLFLSVEKEAALKKLAAAKAPGDGIVSLWCAARLGEKPDPDRLAAKLRSKDWITRLYAVQALDILGELPEEALKDEREEVRAEAARRLANRGSPRAFEEAVKLLASSDGFTKVTACDALALYGAKESEKLAAESLAAIAGARAEQPKGPAIKELKDLRKDADPAVRNRAAAALESIHKQLGAEDLKPLLSDKEPRVQIAAAAALYTIGMDSALSTLFVALRSNDPEISVSAAEQLRKLTGLDYGFDVAKWQQWHERSAGRQFSVKRFLMWVVPLFLGFVIVAFVVRTVGKGKPAARAARV